MSQRLMAYLVIGLAVGLGSVSMLLFAWFCWDGGLGLVDFGLGAPAALAVDAGLSLFFFVQHSAMVRRRFRAWLGKMVADRYDGTVYAIASGFTLLVAVVGWQEVGSPLIAVPGPVAWLMRAGFLAALLIFLWGKRSLRSFDPLGLRPLIASLRGVRLPGLPLAVRGPFRWVRHPLYLGVLLIIWSSPELTVDRLLFNLLWTVWIVFGTWLEERDLVAEFGDSYRHYQREVPMLIPYRRPRRQ